MTRPPALVAVIAFLLTSQVASARPKVALTQIDGDDSGDVRDAVAEALAGKELSLISIREVNRAVGKLGDVADLTEKDLKKLAGELDADAIVLGKLDKVGSSKSLKFRLYVHKKMAKGFTMSFKDAGSEKFRTLLHDKILDKITAASSADADDDRPAKKRKASDDDDEPLATRSDAKARKGARAKKARTDDDDEDARPKKARAGDDDEDARPKKVRAADDEDARPKKARAGDGDEPRPRKATASDDDEPRPKKPRADDARPARRADADEEDAPRRTKKRAAASDDGDDVEGGLSATAEPTGRAGNRVAIRLDVGLSVLQRTFKFNATPAATSPKNTSLTPVPGVRFEAEAYPLALSDPRSIAAGIGLGVAYDKTVALNVTGSANGASVTVPVKQSAYALDLLYRLALGKSDTSPSLTLGIGYGKRLFSPQIPGGTDPAIVLPIRRDTPTTEYAMIEPSVVFRLPVTRTVALSVAGRGLLITNAGPIQTGDSYGRATVYGAQARAAVDVMLSSRFALRFAGDFTQVGFTFQGLGQLSDSLDGDMTTKDVGGLADRAIGGSATLGVLY
jgi:hypothetical protein